MSQSDIDRYGPGCVSAIGEMSSTFQDERIAEGRLTLGGLIEGLSSLDPALPVGTSDGAALRRPHSYRGYYVDLSFEPDRPGASTRAQQTVGELLTLARNALGAEFPGWKSGTFRMNPDTPVWVAAVGDTGEFMSGISLSSGRVVIETDAEVETY